MAEAPRTSWTYLKGPWHSFVLELDKTGVTLKEYWDPGKDPNVSNCSLAAFLEGKLHDDIIANMNSGVLGEALASAKAMAG